MNRKKIFASLLVIVLILIIFAQNILLTEVPSSPAEGAVSIPPVKAVMPAPPAEVTTPLPPVEATIPIPAAEATIPLPPAEATIPLPPIDVTLPILPEKETFFTPLPTERKRENVGMDKCIKCHKDQSARWEGTIHAKWSPSFTTPEKAKGVKIECETCHGPGSLHVEDNKERLFIISFGPGSKDTKAEQNTVCLKCHEKGGLYYWNGGVHGRNLRCADCHHVMDNISRRYLLNKTSEKEICFQCHVRQKSEGFRSPHLSHDEAKMTCSTCHTPHGSSTQGLLSASSVNENCYNCHADKRGPYLFEHLPVQENCLLCHKPHSSIHRPLLKVRQPFLCLECHSNLPVKSTGMPDPHNVMDPRSRYVYNRGCTNCHPMIHGSKHPSGARLQR